MDPFQRLSSLWNWLLPFRAVAEVENLPAASKKLNISASALSRTVRLLEEDLGHPLFDRVGRRLVLNNKGATLLAAVRNAMRLVNDAIDTINSAVMSGPVRIASPGSFMPILVLPALRLLKRRHPELRPVLESVLPGEIADQLIAGGLDLVITDQPVRMGDDLTADLLFEASYGVYCGEGHPLYQRDPRDIDMAAITEHEFAAPPEVADHWPVHIERIIGIQTNILSTGVELCGSGDFLAVLPDIVARVPHDFAPLRRLPFEVCAPVPMYAVYRQPITAGGQGSSSPVAALLTALRETVGATIPG